MKFEPGHKLSKGRPKGALNKRTLELRAVLEEYGFCPITAMLDIHKIAMARFVEEIDKEDSGRQSPMESKASHYLKTAADMAKDIASYTYPKLKAIEQTRPDPLAGMSAEQRLAAMRMAVSHLEAQVKDGDGSSAP